MTTRTRHDVIIDRALASLRRWARTSVHPTNAAAADYRSREIGRQLWRIACNRGYVTR